MLTNSDELENNRVLKYKDCRMDEKISNHPCHRLSIPSAKLFWCRHCMQSFEDPITRWRHSKTCKTGGIENHEKRIEQDVSALQQYCESKQREEDISRQNHGTTTEILETVTGEQLVIVKHETVENENDVFEKIEQKGEYSCFICKRPFQSLEDMKEHVKYPCSKREPFEHGSFLIPGSGGTTFIDPPPNCFPNSSRKQQVLDWEPLHPKPTLPIITRQPVLGEIIEQSADPSTGVRTFEVHSQNDDIPLSDILSKLSEGGYLVAGEEASSVNQVVVVQQVDEKGQITQTEHILPPHIQIQQGVQDQEPQSEIQEPVQDEIEADVIQAIQGIDENSQEGEITYYITETGQLVKEPMELKSGNKELFYYDDDQFAGMNILTQAAEATMGNLIYPEKRKVEEDEDDENVKRSRVQCKPEEEFGSHNPPEPPRSPRNDYPSFENGTIRILGRVSQSEATNGPSSYNDGQNGKQQRSSQGEQPMDTTEISNSRYVDRSHSIDLPISSHLAHYPQSDLNQNNSKLSNGLPSQTLKEEKTKIPDKGREFPEIPHKKAKKSRRRYSYEDEFKCRICDKTFRTSQLLSRHSQYPCKIFNTRNMSQKVLRPKRGTSVGKLLNTSNQKSFSKNLSHSNSKSQSPKTVVNVYRKPMLLLHGLKVSTLFEEKKKSKKVKKKPEPSYIPTIPRIKTIWLPNEKLIVDELPEKEHFFYELDLVGCYHLTGEQRPISPVEIAPNIFNLENDEFMGNLPSSGKTSDIFSPLTISTDIDCSRNISLLEDFSPPILERMDVVNSPEMSSPNLPDEPPVLVPVIEAVTKSEKILDDSDYVFDFSSTPKSKTPETRRHFMDLFIEASPITAQKQNGSQEISDNEADGKTSSLKNMMTKNDLISKLTNSLKRKLTPQKILPTLTKATVPTKRSLFSAFENIPVKTPAPTKKHLILPISKLNGVKSPSKVNVVIFKQKSQFRKFVERKTIKKQVIADHELEDDICELLDNMLEKVASQNTPNIGSSSDIKLNSNVPEVIVKDALNSVESESTKTETLAATSWKKLKSVLNKQNEIKKLLNSMLMTVTCHEKSKLASDKIDIQNLINDAVNKLTDSCETLDTDDMLSDNVCEILNTIIIKISDKQINFDVKKSVDEIMQKIVNDHTNLEVREILNEMVSNVVSKRQADLMRNEVGELLNKIEGEISDNLEAENLKVNRNGSESFEMDVKSDVNANNLTSKLETIKIEVDDGEDMFFVMKDGNLILKEMVSDFDADDFSQTASDMKNESLDSNESYSDNAKDSDFQNGFSNSDDNSNSRSEFNSNSESVRHNFHDEGIVSDMSADDNSERDMSKSEATRLNVTVQYINRINLVDALTSEKLNFGLDNDFDKEGSPDYLVSKIAFNEEEIVLNDSGLDDCDELVSQSSLDSSTILHDVSCYTKFP